MVFLSLKQLIKYSVIALLSIAKLPVLKRSFDVLEGKVIKGSWEPLITIKEFVQLQKLLSQSKQLGVAKLAGKETTPLVPKFSYVLIVIIQ